VSALLSGALTLAGCSRCEGTRREVQSLPDLPYPSCDPTTGIATDGELPEPELVARDTLRAGPNMREQDVVERFEIQRRGCVTIARVQQEWPLGTADLDVVYDEELLPLRVWKRTTMPGADDPLGHLDVARYELRTDRVGMTRRGPDGTVERAELIGQRPRAIIGPGRGLLTVWFQRANLAQGGRLREWVLDVREPIALLREVTLKRERDQSVEGVGRVRVYTIYGREPVFANDDDVVIGDMLGMRRASALSGPIPDPLPDPGPIDPMSGYE
jgi:hypothetical protein